MPSVGAAGQQHTWSLLLRVTPQHPHLGGRRKGWGRWNTEVKSRSDLLAVGSRPPGFPSPHNRQNSSPAVA